jgi:hypothetical protein
MKAKAKTNVPRTAKLSPSRSLPRFGEEPYEVTGGRADQTLTRMLNRIRYLETGERGEPRRRKTRGKEKEKQTAFLRAFGDNCDLAGSAQLVGIKLTAHYRWLATDPEYKDAFEATIPMALGALEDSVTHLALHGWFEPLIYQGEFRYALRKRTICQLADGTTAFEDELPKGARVTGRSAVSTADGEMLGRIRHDEGLLLDLVAKTIPERYGRGRRKVKEECGIGPEATEARENTRALLCRKLNIT